MARPPKKRPTKKSPPRRKSPGRRSARPAQVGERSGERLQKAMAAAGVASRRECELLITEGRVQVDGEVVSELGSRVEPEQEIRVDGEAITQQRRVYFAVHKPTGVVSTASDPSGRPRVIDLIPPEVGRVFNVGRLDLASEGLILLTNDGELANGLTHPKHGVDKTYEVQVAGLCTPEVLAQLRQGMYLAEGFARVVHVKIKKRIKQSTVLEMVLDEGRNREIRRLLARVGHKVQRLTRIAVGPIRLADLPRGAYRPLTTQEIKKLRDAISTSSARPRRSKPSGAQLAKTTRGTRRKPLGSAAKKTTTGKPATGNADLGQSTRKKFSSSRSKPSASKPTASHPTTKTEAPAPRRKVIGEIIAEKPAPKKENGGQGSERNSEQNKIIRTRQASKTTSKATGKTTGKTTGRKPPGKKPFKKRTPRK